MKSLLIIFITVLSFFQNTECGDSVTYANETQTKYDKRLSDYLKISSVPTYSEGEEAFNKLIDTQLNVKDAGKQLVFRLNYRFTVTCNGEIKDFQSLGSAKSSDLTNMQEIIKSTTGKWVPAEKDDKPVDCIYFAKKTIIGSNY